MTTFIRAARELGATGPVLFPIGLSRMGMSGMYGPSNAAKSIVTLSAAMDAGLCSHSDDSQRMRRGL